MFSHWFMPRIHETIEMLTPRDLAEQSLLFLALQCCFSSEDAEAYNITLIPLF